MISCILVVYAILFYPIIVRSFKIKSKNRWNSLIAIISMIIIAIFISLPFSATIFYLYMPLSFYTLVVAGTFILLFFVFAMVRSKSDDIIISDQQIIDEMDNSIEKSILDIHKFTPKQEMKRKIIHLMTIFYLASWIVQPLIFYGVVMAYDGISNTTTLENYHNVNYLFEDKNIEIMLCNGLIIQFFMFLCIFWYNIFEFMTIIVMLYRRTRVTDCYRIF